MKELKRDAYGRTILTHYISGEQTEQAIKMIKNADIDYNLPDKGGYTYLHFAAQREQPDIVKDYWTKGLK
ncbi:MAG: ankyrin repeat domain-containing protein [Lachnospiraceae bacterium]|nr:ankyrin repeat domain-containing protein [Lachnospiraceae bacterium]MDE7201980.1 ankyrin repeat domain-containing protein [Lachnospiraceae bacterium]